MATPLFVIAGIIWLAASSIPFSDGKPKRGAVYIVVGLMNIAVGMVG